MEKLDNKTCSLFTEKDLNEFDKLTTMKSSLNQIGNFLVRLRWNKWVKKNNFSKYILDEMRNELVRRERR